MPNTLPERRKEHIEVFTRLENKIDEINNKSLSTDEREYVIMAMKREARKERFREAVIQKTTISLLWSIIVAIGYLLWQGITSHWKW